MNYGYRWSHQPTMSALLKLQKKTLYMANHLYNFPYVIAKVQISRCEHSVGVSVEFLSIKKRT